MDVQGKILLFPEVKQGKDGESFIIANASVSTKKGETYIHKSMRVIFDKEKYPTAKLLKAFQPGNCYPADVVEGWICVEAWKNKEGKEIREFALYVKALKLHEPKPINKPAADDGLDF